VELALFRVVQEALTNVNRHSDSTTARVLLRHGRAAGKRAVILTVEGAGKGRSEVLRAPATNSRKIRFNEGVGLTSMRERLHQIGGRLEVEFASGRSLVTAIVPGIDANRPATR
jgi:two-component system, NarL family, sensor kinase